MQNTLFLNLKNVEYIEYKSEFTVSSFLIMAPQG